MTDIPSLDPQYGHFSAAQNSMTAMKRSASSLSMDGAAKDLTALKKVCADFESLFVAQMLKDMRSSIPKNDLFHGGGQSEEIYTSMLDESYAKEIAINGSLGLGKQLYETLSKNLANSINLGTKA